jgi:hypothetical protein
MLGETGEFEALAAQPRYGEFRQYLSIQRHFAATTSRESMALTLT